MKREGRWEAQKALVRRLTKITTRILPNGEGVALRFINREVDNSSNLDPIAVGKIMDPMQWQPGGNTEIGTYLRSRILEPLVYANIRTQSLDRPLLVCMTTNGMPEPEDKSKLSEAILKCGKELEKAGYPRKSTCIGSVVFLMLAYLLTALSAGVMFVIGQIGTAKSSTKFLESLRLRHRYSPCDSRYYR